MSPHLAPVLCALPYSFITVKDFLGAGKVQHRIQTMSMYWATDCASTQRSSCICCPSKDINFGDASNADWTEDWCYNELESEPDLCLVSGLQDQTNDSMIADLAASQPPKNSKIWKGLKDQPISAYCALVFHLWKMMWFCQVLSVSGPLPASSVQWQHVAALAASAEVAAEASNGGAKAAKGLPVDPVGCLKEIAWKWNLVIADGSWKTRHSGQDSKSLSSAAGLVHLFHKGASANATPVNWEAVDLDSRLAAAPPCI